LPLSWFRSVFAMACRWMPTWSWMSRFLPNPHFVPELRSHSGLEPEVREFVRKQPTTAEFISRFQSLLEFLLPCYRREGKSYLTIAIGCTGGRHRSVALVELLAEWLDSTSTDVRISHRDLEKG